MISEWNQLLLDIERVTYLASRKRNLNAVEASELVSLRFKLSTSAPLLYENLKRLGEYGSEAQQSKRST